MTIGVNAEKSQARSMTYKAVPHGLYFPQFKPRPRRYDLRLSRRDGTPLLRSLAHPGDTVNRMALLFAAFSIIALQSAVFAGVGDLKQVDPGPAAGGFSELGSTGNGAALFVQFADARTVDAAIQQAGDALGRRFDAKPEFLGQQSTRGRSTKASLRSPANFGGRTSKGWSSSRSIRTRERALA